MKTKLAWLFFLLVVAVQLPAQLPDFATLRPIGTNATATNKPRPLTDEEVGLVPDSPSGTNNDNKLPDFGNDKLPDFGNDDLPDFGNEQQPKHFTPPPLSSLDSTSGTNAMSSKDIEELVWLFAVVAIIVLAAIVSVLEKRFKARTSPSGSPAKRILKWAAVVFVASCLIPPWQFTADRNGSYGYHSRKPAGYSLLFVPPTNPNESVWNGVQIDFGRLFLEWAALAAITGTVWMLVVKPAWLHDDKANRPQKFTPPTANPEN